MSSPIAFIDMVLTGTPMRVSKYLIGAKAVSIGRELVVSEDVFMGLMDVLHEQAGKGPSSCFNTETVQLGEALRTALMNGESVDAEVGMLNDALIGEGYEWLAHYCRLNGNRSLAFYELRWLVGVVTGVKYGIMTYVRELQEGTK